MESGLNVVEPETGMCYTMYSKDKMRKGLEHLHNKESEDWRTHMVGNITLEEETADGGRFQFRNILQEEAEQAARIEEICFPPNEACSAAMMRERVEKAPELFLVAVDRQSGKIAGFLNGLATDEDIFRDAFFMDAQLYDPSGRNVMLLGLDVLPEYRGQGLAREIVSRYASRERALILTCLEPKVQMYEKMGFEDRGLAHSSWGGEQWHEMRMELSPGSGAIL